MGSRGSWGLGLGWMTSLLFALGVYYFFPSCSHHIHNRNVSPVPLNSTLPKNNSCISHLFRFRKRTASSAVIQVHSQGKKTRISSQSPLTNSTASHRTAPQTPFLKSQHHSHTPPSLPPSERAIPCLFPPGSISFISDVSKAKKRKNNLVPLPPLFSPSLSPEHAHALPHWPTSKTIDTDYIHSCAIFLHSYHTAYARHGKWRHTYTYIYTQTRHSVPPPNLIQSFHPNSFSGFYTIQTNQQHKEE